MEKCLAYDIYRALNLIMPRKKTFEDRLARQFHKEFKNFEESYEYDYDSMFNFGDWYILETYNGGVLELVARIVGNMISKRPILLSLNNKSIKRLYTFYNSLQYIPYKTALTQYYENFLINELSEYEDTKKIHIIKELFNSYKEIFFLKLQELKQKRQSKIEYVYYDYD